MSDLGFKSFESCLEIRTTESHLRRNNSDSFPSAIFNVSLFSVEFEIFLQK